ncbi:MAG: PBPRA1643 family SWIM/SEC-C metal-binding motif protein [Planctomycetota bacterium]
MPRLGSSKQPAIVRVQTQARAEEVLSVCNQYGWQVIVEVEPDKDEDLFDVERLLRASAPATAQPSTGRNEPCPCGSGRKYKKCCASNAREARG